MRLTSFTFAAFFGPALLLGSCGDDDSNGDDGEDSVCLVSSGECVNDCITTQCGASVSACSADATCDMAKDTMVSCVCDAQRHVDAGAVDACMSTFGTQGGSLAMTFGDCATTSCATACGL